MNLKRIRYFVAVAEEMHFGRAAARLNVVQPAISQQIKLLEEDLGMQLLERSSRRVMLTQAGQAFLAEARRVVQQVEVATQAARDAIGGRVGLLRVGFVDSAVWTLLPTVIRAFRTQYPRIALSLAQMPRTPQLERLENSELDVAIVPGPVMREGITAVELARTSLCVALPKGHHLAAREKVEIEALAREAFVALPLAEDPRRINEVVHHLCANAGFEPILGQAVEQMHTTLSLVSAGLGVGIVPQWASKAWSDNIEYRVLLPETDYVLVLCYREGRASGMIDAWLRTIGELVPFEGQDRSE